MHFGKVSRELGLLEGAFQHILMGYGYLTPGLHRSRSSSISMVKKAQLVFLSGQLQRLPTQ